MTKNTANAPDLGPGPDDIPVCFCHGVSDAEIRKAISAGAKTVDEIKVKTLASTGCGGCTSEVERILADALATLSD